MADALPDAFDALRDLLPETAPDPSFVTALRDRVERALLDAPGGPVSPSPVSPGPVSLSPYLAVSDARAALRSYEQVLGAVPRGEPVVMTDGRVGHAELALGDAVLMLADEFPETGLLGPLARGGVSASQHLSVPDPDGVVERAGSAGWTVERPVRDDGYGRTGVVVDPYGHRWMVQEAPPAAPAPGPRHGDVAYLTLGVRDGTRAQRFYGSVLGWTFAPGSTPGGFEVEGRAVMTGLWGGADRSEVQLCYAVDDVEAAVQRVREAGGTAEQPQAKPYGRLAECTDGGGTRFQLWQAPD